MPEIGSGHSKQERRSESVHNIPELLAPAGSFEKMVTALHYGADAVYCGGKRFSLRAHAGNFSEKELGRAVQYVHDRNKKLYVTVNILAHQKDLQGLEGYLGFLRDITADGIIVSDPGIFMLARKSAPDLPIHLSTQANVTNLANARFWRTQGVKRLNLARELSLPEIAEIRRGIGPGTEIEVFVHGALCISYSGRCLLSCYFTGRDANQGDCAHPCRYRYALQEEKRPGQYFPVEEDEYGTYIFNSKDLCLLEKLPRLIDTGIDSFKIEGRMKSVYYVGAVVRVYRAALDYIAAAMKENPTALRSIKLPPVYLEELMKVGTRGYTENFIYGPPEAQDMLYDKARTDPEYAPAGVIQDFGRTGQGACWLTVESRTPFRKGDILEYLGKDIEAVSFEIKKLQDQDEFPLEQANPGNVVRIEYESAITAAWEKNSLLRIKVKAG